MPVNQERMARDFAAIAACTATPGAGASRPTFSPAWRRAVEHVVAEAERAGCQGRFDAAGNLHVRPGTLPAGRPAWLSGSHLDSVPHGGDYDGVLGVVAALEVLRSAHEDGVAVPLEAIVFAEEEGTTFGLGMLGSRGWTGDLGAAALGRLANAAGETYWQAGAPHGADPERLPAERLRPDDYLGLVEVHVEQGPALWKASLPVAVVTAIAGRRQYVASFLGAANHAGSTSMADRRDALAAAAEVIAAVEALAARLGPRSVATVGRIEVVPNAVNVIPAVATFTIDLRAPDDAALERGDRALRETVTAVADRRGLSGDIRLTERQPAVALDAGVVGLVRAAAERIGLGPPPETVSGALHDAAILAPLVPTAMIFVASRDGISHNPAEFSRPEDMAAAARLLYETVRGPLPRR